MGNRLSKIYTRTGDDGSTGLGDGSRIDKDSLRIEAIGTVDELNSAVGILLARPLTPVRDSMSGFFALHRDTWQRAARLDPIEALRHE